MEDFEPDLFVACKDGSTERNWTLATRLGDLLSDAEHQFGPRDTTYTFLGIEFAGARPMIWFPGDRKQIVIQLSLDSINDLPRACYQLGHESIHLLAPTGRQDANCLEEGLATYFGENYATKWFGSPRGCGAAEYERVKTIVRNALAVNPMFVRQIREHKPSFGDITPTDILNYVDVSRKEAEILCQPFHSI